MDLNYPWDNFEIQKAKKKTNWLEIIVCVGMVAVGVLIIWLALKDIV